MPPCLSSLQDDMKDILLPLASDIPFPKDMISHPPPPSGRVAKCKPTDSKLLPEIMNHARLARSPPPADPLHCPYFVLEIVFPTLRHRKTLRKTFVRQDKKQILCKQGICIKAFRNNLYKSLIYKMKMPQ